MTYTANNTSKRPSVAAFGSRLLRLRPYCRGTAASWPTAHSKAVRSRHLQCWMNMVGSAGRLKWHNNWGLADISRGTGMKAVLKARVGTGGGHRQDAVLFLCLLQASRQGRGHSSDTETGVPMPEGPHR